jgi:tetratricopeptide (TPR) repeat protein
LGSILRKQGELAAAEVHLTSLKRTWEDLDPRFNTLTVQQLRANSLQILGAVVAQLGRWDEATKLFQECVAAQQIVVDAVPWNPQLKYELAITIYDLGRVQIDRRQPAEALPWLQRAEPLLAQLDRENPQQVKFMVAYVTNLNTTAICATLVGQRELAGRALERLFQVFAAKPAAMWETNLELVLVHSRASLVRVHWLTEEKRTSEIPAILSQAREVVEQFTARVKPTPELKDLIAKIQAAEQAASPAGERLP